MMDNLSGTENKKLYLVTDYYLIENGRQYDNFEILPGAGYMEEVKSENQEATFSSLANAIINSIYHDLKGRVDKIICISCHKSNIINFVYANNVLDTIAEILDNFCDPNVLVVNIVPYELSYWTQYYDNLGIDDNIYVDKVSLRNIINKYEYLGFRPYPNENDVNDNNVLIYMNSAGINVYNNKLKIMEYDHGK